MSFVQGKIVSWEQKILLPFVPEQLKYERREIVLSMRWHRPYNKAEGAIQRTQ